MWLTIVSFIIGTICAALIIRWCAHCANGGQVVDTETPISTIDQHSPVDQRRQVLYPTRVRRSPSDLAAMATIDALIRDRYSMYAPSNKVKTPKNNPMPMKRKKVIPTNQECSICLDNISENAIQCCQCGHCFHEKCIKRWLENHTTCPLCRQTCGLTF